MTETAIFPGTVTTVLDGTGAGLAKVGPIGAREVWSPSLVSVHASSNVAEAACQILFGDTVSQIFVDSTLSGSTGDATGRISAYTVRLGQFVWAKWSGGDPGAVATLTVAGTKTV